MTLNKALSAALLFGVFSFWACKKDNPELSGTASVSSFSFEVKRSPGEIHFHLPTKLRLPIFLPRLSVIYGILVMLTPQFSPTPFILLNQVLRLLYT